MGTSGGILVVLNCVFVECHNLHRNHFSLEMGDVNRAIMSPDRQGKQYLCIDSSARKVTLGVRSDESSL